MLRQKQAVDEIVSAFQEKDGKRLRKVNDRILREAVVNFTSIFYELAVLSYILSKIALKPRYLKKENEQRLKELKKKIHTLADIKDENVFRSRTNEIYILILSLEEVDKRFVTNLIEKGKIKVGATLYAQGISLGKASELTGIGKQSILSYAGKTMMFDRVKEEKGILERLKRLRRLFGP